MDELERNLREVFRRREPPEDFGERLRARRRAPGPRSWPSWVAAAAAAALIAGAVMVDSYQTRRARGEQAKEEVLRALRVTGSTLDSVRERVSEISDIRFTPAGRNDREQ